MVVSRHVESRVCNGQIARCGIEGKVSLGERRRGRDGRVGRDQLLLAQ